MTRYIARWTVIGLTVGCIVGLAMGAGYWSLFAVLVGAGVGWEVGVCVHLRRRKLVETRDAGGHVRIVDREVA